MAKSRKKRSEEKKRKVIGVILFVVALLFLVSLVSHRAIDDIRIIGEVDHYLSPFEISYGNQGGMAGAYLSYFCFALLGWLSYFLPLAFILISLRLFKSEMSQKLNFNTFLLFVISLLGTIIYNIHAVASRVLSVDYGIAGGYFTEKLTVISVKMVGELGSYLLLGGIVFILLMLYTSITPFLAAHLRLPGAQVFKKVYSAVAGVVRQIFSFDWLSRSSSDEDADEEEEPESGRDEFHSYLEAAEEEVPDAAAGDDEHLDAESGLSEKYSSDRKKAAVL